VIQVSVQLGQTVESGDSLLTLEAMKMEQTVCAPLSGVVAQIHVESGDSVPAGALLIEIEPQP
jgi:biotin carboxyl carrier protein